MKRVAIVKTFMRPEVFAQCITALIAAGTEEVLVAFDGPSEYWEPHKKIVFEANQIIDAEIYRFPFDYGLAACRNRLIEMISEPYFLMVDDDIIVIPSIWSALPVMTTSKKLAAATFGWFYGGVLQIDAWDINIKNGEILTKTVRWPKQIVSINGFTFYYPFDFVPNQGFWSRKFFNELRWDEHYIIEGEHEDMAMQVFPTDWFFAVCTNVFLYHLHDWSEKEYHKHRFSEIKMSKSWMHFFQKWNLKEYRDGQCLLPWLPLHLLKRVESTRESVAKCQRILGPENKNQNFGKSM